MPNYILSRTSPPANFYERKVNLGYGVKVDTSDAPQPEPKKEKKMQDVSKENLDVAERSADANPVNGQVVKHDHDNDRKPAYLTTFPEEARPEDKDER